MRVVTIAVFAACFLCAVVSDARGQTTKPAAANFSTLFQKIADGIVAGDTSALGDALDEQGTLEGFEQDGRQHADRLALAGSGGTIVSVHAYAQTPTNLASDLANDFAKADYVSESVRKEMIPENDAVVRANVTASQWISQVLDPGRKQMVGVIVVWPKPETRVINIRQTPQRPVFVLIKGDIEGGKVKLKQVVFGNPLESVK